MHIPRERIIAFFGLSKKVHDPNETMQTSQVKTSRNLVFCVIHIRVLGKEITGPISPITSCG